MNSKRKNWKQIYKGKLEGFDPNISLEYWENQSVSHKFEETLSLIEQALKIKGKTLSDVSRLLRTTAVLKRQ